MAQSGQCSPYSPLSPHEIRIFHISGFTALPTSGLDLEQLPMKCRRGSHILKGELKIVSLNKVKKKADDYAALSYRWDKINVRERRGIICNSTVMRIRPNLHDALCNFARRYHAPKAIWVDALCINQEDLEEKSAQVEMMGRIYSTVGHVIAWLGDGDHMAPLFSYLERCQAIVHRQRFFPPEYHVQCGLSYLEHCEYFKRAWTFQEICLARSVVVQVGNDSIEWSILAPNWCEPALIPAFDDIRRMASSITWIEAARERKDLSLLYLLRSLWARECSDMRDKVFAILGMYSGPATLTADYTLSVRQTVVRASQAVVEGDRSLDILHYARLSKYNSKGPSDNGCSEDQRLPSWMPDWGYCGHVSHWGAHHDIEHYKVLEFPQMNPDFVLNFRWNGEHIIVAGMALGRVVPFEDGERDRLEYLVPFPACVFQRADGDMPWPNRHRLKDALEMRAQTVAHKTDMVAFLEAIDIHDAGACKCQSPIDRPFRPITSKSDLGAHIPLNHYAEEPSDGTVRWCATDQSLQWAVVPFGARSVAILNPSNRPKPKRWERAPRRCKSVCSKDPSASSSSYIDDAARETFLLSDMLEDKFDTYEQLTGCADVLGCLSCVYGDFELA